MPGTTFQLLESIDDTALRLRRQISRHRAKVYYVAWGTSLRFICFGEDEHSYTLYGDDINRLVGAYSRLPTLEELKADITAFLKERGYV